MGARILCRKIGKNGCVRHKTGGIRRAIIFAAVFSLAGIRCAAEVCFVQISDLHIKDQASAAFVARAVDWLNDPRTFGNRKPAFIAITGDISNKGTKAELQLCRVTLSKLKLPWYVIPGNHDVIAHGRPCDFDRVFPSSNRYAVEVGGYRFLFDSGSMNAVTSNRMPSFDDWLTSQMSSAPANTRFVVFTHYPYGKSAPHRLGGWLREKVIKVSRNGRVLAVLSGHSHADSTSFGSGVIFKTIPCLSSWRHNRRGTQGKVAALYVVDGGKVSMAYLRMPGT
jgi:predicted phosphodiesterase